MARSRSGTRGRRGPRKPPRREGAFTSPVQVVDPKERGAIEPLRVASSVGIWISAQGSILYVIGTVSGGPLAAVAENTILPLCGPVLRLSGRSVTSTVVEVVS